MSLQTDARACLRKAIAERNKVDVPPEKMGDLKPSDGDIGAKDGTAWRITLDLAAELLRDLKYKTRSPDLEEATRLLDEVLTESQAYLETLSRPPKTPMATLLFIGGTIAAIGALATAFFRAPKDDK